MATYYKHGVPPNQEAIIVFGSDRGHRRGFYENVYAIPINDVELNPLPIESIRIFINAFIGFASSNPAWDFCVMGFENSDIAPLFRKASDLDNVSLPEEWKSCIEDETGDSYNGVS